MLLAVETTPSTNTAAARHESGMGAVLRHLVDRLKPAFPKASVSVFMKDGGTIMYTVDPLGNSNGQWARSYGEAEQLIEDRLLHRPLSVEEMARTLGVDQAWPGTAR